MIGGDSDDDSGEEEVLEDSSLTPSLGAIVKAEKTLGAAEPPPLLDPPVGWTTHQSSRYRNSRFPEGYVYYFDPATGNRRWAVPKESARGKRSRDDEADLGGLYYSSLPRDIGVEELQRLVLESNGHIKVSGQGSTLSVKYFCDQAKKWPFDTDRAGLVQLCHLVRINREPLALCEQLIESEGKGNAEKVRRDGKTMYTEKKHLIQGIAGQEKVTWSQDEYAHPGMQLVYLSLKSWQRFTETWAMLERSHNIGFFEAHKPGGALAGRPVRVLSIGGGPGFELAAFERFFRAVPGCAQVPLQLVSLDLMPKWKPLVEAMGMQFGVYDIKGQQSLHDVAASLNEAEGKGPFPAYGITYVLISYVMIYVSTPEVCAMLKRLLEARGGQGGVRAILVSERGEETKALKMMETLGTQVHRLIDQTDGLDERQSLWLSGSTRLMPPASRVPTMFPNVPFEDNKKRKNVPHPKYY